MKFFKNSVLGDPIARSSIEQSHEHELHAIECQRGFNSPLTPAVTVVLFGCVTCTHVETELLQGQWTLEQVTRFHAEPGAPNYTRDLEKYNSIPPMYGA